MAEDSTDAVVDVYLNEAEASKWALHDFRLPNSCHVLSPRPEDLTTLLKAGASDMQSFAASFAGWAAQPSRKFSGLDIERLLRNLRNGKIRFRVIGYNEFPYKKTWIEREYWLVAPHPFFFQVACQLPSPSRTLMTWLDDNLCRLDGDDGL
eukprot:3940062-Rhodomonas_salina.1